jgi:hypothetical protein
MKKFGSTKAVKRSMMGRLAYLRVTKVGFKLFERFKKHYKIS